MNDPEIKRIAEILESNRSALPKDFEAIADQALGDLANGKAPRILAQRGDSRSISPKLARAIVSELHCLLCTEDARFAPLRKQAKTLSEGTVLAIAGFMSGKFDVSLALASAAVGFFVLGILRIGVGAFCRVTKKVKPECSLDY